MPTYFQNCTTLDALTKERNRLAKIHHPDVGGSLATMQDINAEYEQAKRRLESHGAGRTYTQPAPKPSYGGRPQTYGDDWFEDAVDAAIKEWQREEQARRTRYQQNRENTEKHNMSDWAKLDTIFGSTQARREVLLKLKTLAEELPPRGIYADIVSGSKDTLYVKMSAFLSDDNHTYVRGVLLALGFTFEWGASLWVYTGHKEYQPFRDQVDQQKLKLKEELAWGLNQIRLAQAQGLLRHCTAYTDRMQTTLKVGGNTYPYREWFKAHGFRWDPEKKQWHFHKKPLFYEEEDEEDDDELDPQDIPC
jgi:hypothetical protein